MELKIAKEVLEGMTISELSAYRLYNQTPYILIYGNPYILIYGKRSDDDPHYGKGLVDGNFTADQLEAIATWMRDPDGVMKA